MHWLQPENTEKERETSQQTLQVQAHASKMRYIAHTPEAMPNKNKTKVCPTNQLAIIPVAVLQPVCQTS